MLETILGVVSAIGTVATTGNAVVELMDKIKKSLSKEDVEGMASGQAGQPIHYAYPSMTAFQPQMPNPYGHGNQWLPQLQALAQQHGNPWVPAATQPLLGINLTGIWIPPGNPYDQTFIRQYGPYINVIGGVAGTPNAGFAEGLFDPTHGVIHVVGRTIYGAPFEARGQLLPNWWLQGWMRRIGLFGQPEQAPYIMGKVA